jgi:5-formyltetrahydrofolate cyclo-ligase
MISKLEARRFVREKRANLSKKWLQQASVQLCERAAKWLLKSGFKKISLFLSYDGEPLTDYLFTYCLATEREVYVPVADYKKKILFHARLTNLARTIADPRGIRVPEDREKLLGPQDFKPEVVFCPGLAFDLKGNRVGHGEGFYDRLLSLHMLSVKVGLAFDFQIFEEIETEEHDVKMDLIITEKRLIEL